MINPSEPLSCKLQFLEVSRCELIGNTLPKPQHRLLLMRLFLAKWPWGAECGGRLMWGRTCVGGDLNPVALNPGGRSDPQHLHRVVIQDPKPQIGRRSHCERRKPGCGVKTACPACSCRVLSVYYYIAQNNNDSDDNNSTIRKRESFSCQWTELWTSLTSHTHTLAHKSCWGFYGD